MVAIADDRSGNQPVTVSADNDLVGRSSIIIPVLNAASHLEALLPALKASGYPPERILVVDSYSKDDTVSQFEAFGARVVDLDGQPFNHGGTRKYATTLVPESEFLIFLTQDAIPADSKTFDNILSVFEQTDVGMAYGRQLPRLSASPIERHARLLNYNEQDEIRTWSDRTTLGMKTTFCSDSFAAYRRDALEAVGNFPEDSYFAEDQITAGRMLKAGYKLAYCANAKVVHSHGYTMEEDFKRYFDVGVFHAQNSWLLDDFGAAEGEGLKFLKSELGYLMRHKPSIIPSALIRTVLKYAGYRLGRMEKSLSLGWKQRLGMQPFYWKQKGISGQVNSQ